jgi:hypothetical protein
MSGALIDLMLPIVAATMDGNAAVTSPRMSVNEHWGTRSSGQSAWTSAGRRPK